MFKPNISKILDAIKPEDKVLDIGGWAQPFNRADYVIDINPYDSRGMLGSCYPGTERFTKETWIQRDICDHQPYPFADKFCDYVICSHTLEDVRDPIFVCSEIIRIGKRGYIEVPSMRHEMTLGVENPRYVGRSHHRWLVDIQKDEIVFTFKYHHLHSNWKYHFPRTGPRSVDAREEIEFIFWEGEFQYREQLLITPDEIHEYFSQYIQKRRAYPAWRDLFENAKEQVKALWRSTVGKRNATR